MPDLVNLPNVNFVRSTFARDILYLIGRISHFTAFTSISSIRVETGGGLNGNVLSSSLLLLLYCPHITVSIVFLLCAILSTHMIPVARTPAYTVYTPWTVYIVHHIETTNWHDLTESRMTVSYYLLPLAFCTTQYSSASASAHWKVCCIDNCTRNTLCMPNVYNNLESRPNTYLYILSYSARTHTHSAIHPMYMLYTSIVPVCIVYMGFRAYRVWMWMVAIHVHILGP